MSRLYPVLVIICLMMPYKAVAFGIGLVPLHSNSTQSSKTYGKNISLHGTPGQIKNLRKWLSQIARVPKGLDTLTAIQQSGHKLFIFHSIYSMISSGKTSAPASSNLINGKGESVDIHFNANIPDQGSHRVLDNSGNPIEYTATQNLYHELAHALHMMHGTWRYFKSEHQAIEEENIFRQQQAEMDNKTYHERVYISGMPICPEATRIPDQSWNQELICQEQ